LLLTGALLIAAAAAPTGASAYSVMTSAEKQEVLVDTMEDFVSRAEASWCTGLSGACAADPNITGADGHFAGGGEGVSLDRGNVAIAVVYATLIASDPAATSWDGVPKSTIVAHATQALRYVAYTNDFYDPDEDPDGGEDPDNDDEWWGGQECIDWTHCLAPNTAAGLAWATQLLWSSLSSGDRGVIQDIVALEAEIVDDEGPSSGPTINQTFAEENAQPAQLLAAAHAFFPSEDSGGTWATSAKKFAYNVSSRAADESDTNVSDGQTIASWVTTVNLLDDFTLRNHGFFHPVYSQGVFNDLSNSAVFYQDASLTIPAAFSFRVAEIWDGLLAKLAWDDGDLVLPLGTDWVTHDYQHIQALAYVATLLDRDDASVLESRAIEQLRARQVANGDGSLYSQDSIGYESENVRTLAGAWWLHKKFGPAPTPTEPQFDAARPSNGVVDYRTTQKTIVGRMRDALVSMSWDDGGAANPTALIVPASRDYLADPVLMQYWPRSGVGGATGAGVYNCRCEAHFFSTAGTIGGTRKFSMTAFDDGSTLLLDRGSGATFTFAFENAPALVGDRPVYTGAGEENETGPLTGEWFNVADRFGMITRGGSGQALEVIEDLDGSGDIDNPQLHIDGSDDNGSGNRGAAVLPLADHTETAALDTDVRQPNVPSSNWSALTARALDGTARIAVANWGGSNATGTISNLSSSLGVPIPDRPNDVVVTGGPGGSAGSSDFNLNGLSSTGEKGYFWVSAGNGNTVTVRAIWEDLIRLTTGGSASSVTVKYDPGPGGEATATGTIPANSVAYATEYNGAVAIVTPSATSVSGSNTAALAFDDTGATYWSSGSTTLSSPQCLVLDMGATTTIGRLKMVPRSGHGPKDFKFQTGASPGSPTNCSSETGWATPTGGTITNSGDGAPKEVAFTPVSARYVRIRVTAAYGSSPYNVGVKELTPAPN
jgi:hypothetical protein